MRILPFLAFLLLLAPAWPASADEKQELDTLRRATENLIELLVQEGVISREKATTLMRKARRDAVLKPGDPMPADAAPAVESAAAPASPEARPVVRVPFVPESVKAELREQIKLEVLSQAATESWGQPNALPDWLDRIKLEGDIRLRYQKDLFDEANAPPFFFNAQGVDIDNTTEDRDRMRIRARLGVLAQITPGLGAGFRISTGNTNDPVSTNQTMGNYQDNYSIVVERAYLKWDHRDRLTVWGGKMPNPWFGTDLVWDEDLNFDGVAGSFRPNPRGTLSPFFTVGAFPLQEVELSSNDKWLYGAQAGLDWELSTRSRFKLGVAYYDYQNTAGHQNQFGSNLLDYTAPQFKQKGNSLFNIDNDGDPATTLFALAPEFQELNLTAAWNWQRFDPVHVTLTGDFVKNIGFDNGEIRQRTGLDIEPRTKGYLARLTVGNAQVAELHEWQASLAYKYLERDAVVDAFTDSDFHLGGTNAKGFILGGSYGLARNTWITTRWLSADEIDGAPLAIDVFQFDVNARF